MAGAMKWTWEENKAFEIKLAQIPESPAKLEIIAEQMDKPVAEIKRYYDKLVHDLAVIESGGDVVPENSPRLPTIVPPKKRPRWTSHEHELFLEGLKQFGPRAWEAISRNFVRTKNAEQVKSHGLYYLKCQKAEAETKERSVEAENKEQNVEAETKEEMRGSDLEESGVEKTGQD